MSCCGEERGFLSVVFIFVAFELSALIVGGANLNTCPAAPSLPAWLVVSYPNHET